MTHRERIWLGIAIFCVASISCDGRPASDSRAVERLDAPAKTILRLRVTGHNFQWRIQYAGADGQLDTDDDLIAAQHLHLPVNSIVEVDLRSEDYAYTFFLPHLDLIETAILDDPFVLRFETDEPGRHELLGSQMCGYTHPLLLGDVVIHTRAGFNEWLSSIE
jgi:heme/copper-type cytochrome/quinol oxidase subunit 2